ncbi:MAG: LysM peptidoglycan-binding domain-containing protein [Mycobacteriales bacterium]
MRARGRDRVLGFFALLVMLLIVAGIPAGLIYFVGWPLPHKMPRSSDFTSQVDWETIVKAIACVIWVLWLQLVWCLLVELKAGIRGRAMAGQVPMSGASQDLARRLVGAFLLLMTASGQLSHLGGGGHAQPRAAVVASVPQVSLGDMSYQQAPQAPPRAIQAAPMPGVYAEQQDGGGGQQAVTTQTAATVTKVYVVKAPQGGYHDNLWDIAERHLGNGLRYHEIYDLNKDHVQPGGGKLTKESLIQPGWRLVMPADATGEDLIIEGQAAPPPVQQQAPAPAAHHQQQHLNPADAPVLDAVYARGGAGGGDGGNGGGSGLSSRPGTSSAMEQIRALADNPTRDARWSLVGGELLAFGLMEALVGARRRQARQARPGERLPRPDQGAAGLEAAMRLRADAAGSEFLGQATRALAAGLAAEGKAVPQFYAVRLAGDVLEFWLTPARLDPPAPFVPENDGNTWVVHRAALPDEPVDAPAPLPGLVCLGDDERGRVLVDLEAAEGVIGVDGPAEGVRALLASLAAELATNSWSDGLRLVLVGFGAEMAALAPDRALVTDDLNAVLDELEARAATVTHALGAGTDGSVMNGRVRGNAQYYLPDYVLVGTPPGEAALDRLRTLSRRARGAFGIVVAGDVPGATWRFRLGPDGMLDTGPLGLRLRAQQLPREAYGALASLLHAANTETGAPAATADGAPAARPARSEPQRVPVVAPQGLDPDQPPGLFVRIFGEPDVFGPPDFAPGTPLTVEIAAYLALRADGVSEQALGAAIWPRGARGAEKTAALRQVGEWLGVDAQGQPRLVTLPDGRLRLTGDVRLDWYQFNALVGRSGPGDLERAVELLRGPIAADRPAGRYSWLAQEAIEYDAPVLAAEACHRLVLQAAGADDLNLATHAARQGLAIDPLSTLLWKDLIKIERTRNGDAGARVIVEEMAQAMRASGTDGLEADVETLLRTFAPRTAAATRPLRRKPVIVAVAA